MRQVSLAFLTNEDKVLLYLRDDRPDISYPGYWALLGGQIEEGETPLMAVRREVHEEIGCHARDLVFMHRIDVVGNPMCDDHTIFLFNGRIDEPLDKMRLTEGQAIRYFTKEEFRGLKFPDPLKPYCQI